MSNSIRDCTGKSLVKSNQTDGRTLKQTKWKAKAVRKLRIMSYQSGINHSEPISEVSRPNDSEINAKAKKWADAPLVTDARILTKIVKTFDKGDGELT